MICANDTQRIVSDFHIKIEKGHQFPVGGDAGHHRRTLLGLIQHVANGILQPKLAADRTYYCERFSIRPPVRATYTFQHLSRSAAAKRHSGESAYVFAS